MNVVDDWNEKAIYRRMKGYLYDFLPGETVSADELVAQTLAIYSEGRLGEHELPQVDGALTREVKAASDAEAKRQSPALLGKEPPTLGGLASEAGL